MSLNRRRMLLGGNLICIPTVNVVKGYITSSGSIRDSAYEFTAFFYIPVKSSTTYEIVDSNDTPSSAYVKHTYSFWNANKEHILSQEVLKGGRPITPTTITTTEETRYIIVGIIHDEIHSIGSAEEYIKNMTLVRKVNEG